jgi:hypothetical protein
MKRNLLGAVAGLLLVAVAAIGGNLCGNQLIERVQAPGKALEKQAQIELAELKARLDAEVKAANERDERALRPIMDAMRSR